jgi:hypothetical protein
MSHRLVRKTSGFLNRRREFVKDLPKGKSIGLRPGSSAKTMKTTTITTRPLMIRDALIRTAKIAGSAQSNASRDQYTRKPAYFQATAGRPASAGPKGQSFREILERELGGGAKAQVVQAAGVDESTNQFLSGYWA